jgi:glycosyltransferase involved in cell wall biosynthesis
MVSTGLHMTELTTKWKELYPNVDISVFTADNSRINSNKTFIKFEIYEGVKINRVKNLGKHHGSLYNRLLFSIGFIIKAFLFLLKNRNKYDKLIITTNPPFLGVLILIFRFFTKLPYVVIAYDIYPQILDKIGILKRGSLVYKFWKWLNIKVFKYASKIISIGEDMTKIIQNEMCVEDDSKIELIYNWSDKNKVFPVSENENQFLIQHGFSGKKILLYSGTMGSTHNIEDILLAAKELRNSDEILFLFIGSGAKVHLVKEYIKNYGKSNVVLLPFQPIEILSQTLSSATMSFVCLDSAFTGLSVPSKAYGIMAAGVPIIGIMDSDSEISKTIEKFNCGVVWNSKANYKLSNIIKETLSNRDNLNIMKTNAYNAFINNFDIEISVEKYNKVLNSIKK